MLDAAKALFIKNGFSKTNMEEIAEHAGFGVATLYNYFKTKEGIFAAMARDDMSILMKDGEAALALQISEPTSAVYNLLEVYNRAFEFISYSVVQEFQDQSKSSGPLHEVSSWVNHWQHAQVSQALSFCQSQKTLSPELDCDLAAEIIIAQLYHHSRRSTPVNREPPDISHLRKVLALVLEGWLCRDS